MNGLLSVLTIKANQRRCARRKIDLVATVSVNSIQTQVIRRRPMSRHCVNGLVVGGRKASIQNGVTTMKKVLLAVGALLLATTAVPASAHDWGYGGNGYNNGYNNGYGGNGYGGNGYGGYGNGYGRDYLSYYRQLRAQLRECRQHQRVHRQLDALHDQAHDERFDNGQDHADTHGALDAAHEQWHRDHPYADDCSDLQSRLNGSNGGYYNRGDRGASWSFSWGN